MIKKIGGVVLILILILGGFIFYGLFILDIDKKQQVQTSLDDSYYQVADLLGTDSLSSPNPNKNAYSRSHLDRSLICLIPASAYYNTHQPTHTAS